MKIKSFVRCGVRTHALIRVSELKSDALDRSANLAQLREIYALYFKCNLDKSQYSTMTKISKTCVIFTIYTF